MAAKILQVEVVNYPNMRLIGKRYLDEDRQDGNFGYLWGVWFSNGYFNELKELPTIPASEGAYLGMMRVVNGKYEYWIGQLFTEGTPVPAGFQFIDIAPIKMANCWIYGNNDDIFGLPAHNLCLSVLNEKGYQRLEDGWCIEKYTCPRFTIPDQAGNVILDYEIQII